ncbi:MAG: DUF424 family protein [Candidatus Heimdallarchaeota archaeon]|nr:DUF424 family protein [Candidatus Heimdallarchaeota archaeon]MBY8993173.1 DUF424 family protein [Candidatus Heimdallarchaeota archaeon]
MPKKQLFYLRVRQTQKEYLVTVCDKELLGKTVSEGELELCVNDHFYGGDLVPLEKCLEQLRIASSFNLIGKGIVDAVIENRMVNELAVMWINCKDHGKVGHVMFLR